MLKAAIKRRRTKREIADEKAMQEEEERKTKAKVSQFDAMAAELEAMRRKSESDGNASKILTDMLSNGQLKMDDDGQVVNPHYAEVRRRKD